MDLRIAKVFSYIADDGSIKTKEIEILQYREGK
jgi:hypothetical protein